jgi:LacI family transcriptional regulator
MVRAAGQAAGGLPRRPVTLADVAGLAGVDRSTVSRILNDDPAAGARPETRERVLQAVRELGYRPNAAARSLRTAKAETYGLFLPDYGNPVYAEIIKGAEAAASLRGRMLLTGSVSGQEIGEQKYLDLIGQGRVDGLLLAGSEVPGPVLDRLNAYGIPWIMLNRRSKQVDRFVILDDEKAAGMAVDHLVELGHERIAHIAGPANADTAKRRKSGYRKALRRAGIPYEDSLVAHADYTPRGGAEALDRLLAAPSVPTAVFVANIASAIGVLQAAVQAQVPIPESLSVVAVHDLALAAYLVPSLSTVRMPLVELGRRGVELLAELPPGEAVAEVLEGPMELLPRASSSAPSPDR